MTSDQVAQQEHPSRPVRADQLLVDLAAPQRQAVTHVQGPLLVLAGAGSGKTRVITRRIAHLVLGIGLAPWNILAITFTNKAAGEMRQRVAQMLSQRQAAAVSINTFHGFCARVIRDYAADLGLPPGFSIYDTVDQTRAVKQVLESLDISSTNFPPGKVLAAISNAKNELLDAEGYSSQANDFYTRTISKVFTHYEQTLTKNKSLDFDDLLIKTVQLMQRQPEALAQLRERYQYVLIDEYQDTNHAQFMIAHMLASEHRNLCATGDPDQSIYSWRGANIRNILEFETHYPDATVVRLEQNYRSTKNILAVADGLIQNNVHRKHKSLWTDNQTGPLVTVTRCYDEQHEAQWIVEQFHRYHDEQHITWNDMAVFYRTNSLSRVIENALRKAATPYQVARGTAFYDRKEIKDAIAYLQTIANPLDELSLLRIINTPARGISDRSVKALRAHAAASQQSLADTIENPQDIIALNSRAVGAVKRFSQMLQSWRTDTAKTQPDSLRVFLVRILNESQLETYYRKDPNDPDGEKIDNLGELVSSAQQFDQEYNFEHQDDPPASLEPKLISYLEQISLVSDVDSVNSQEGAVTLMTLHAAKGLEFPLVAILGLEDGLLPHSQSQDNPRDIEEERRLCFVGITRAKQQLMLTHTRYRMVFGQTQPVIPSRFIAELPSEPIDSVDLEHDDDWPHGQSELGHGDVNAKDVFDDASRIFPPGTMVRHRQFGLGRVLVVNGRSLHTRVRVQFANAGIKTLVLEYAQLEIV